MLSLSKKYNISDGLRKTCIRMSIPMPKAGHWQKLKFGKKIKRVPLLENYQGEQEVNFSLRDENTPFPVRGESPLSVLKQAFLISSVRLRDSSFLVCQRKARHRTGLGNYPRHKSYCFPGCTPAVPGSSSDLFISDR